VKSNILAKNANVGILAIDWLSKFVEFSLKKGKIITGILKNGISLLPKNILKLKYFYPKDTQKI